MASKSKRSHVFARVVCLLTDPYGVCVDVHCLLLVHITSTKMARKQAQQMVPCCHLRHNMESVYVYIY